MFPEWVNLPLVFVLLTFGTGLVVALDKWYLKPRREQQHGEDAKLPMMVDVSRAFFPVLAVILVLRSFVFEPYRIPSESMLPNLLIGDFVVVSKFSYGLRLPVSNTLIWETGAPQRGDVAVFRKPGEPNINFIKRVIGLPGDRVVYENQRLTINGELVDLERDEPFTNENNRGIVFTETFAGEGHSILLQYAVGRGFEYTVGDDCYFMMGDNRDRSRDSRFREIGCVPEANLVGRATRIWMSWKLWDMPRWSRIGNKIQ
ncbi:MAG: signal peptidase I [Pseudomonadota bacterium]